MSKPVALLNVNNTLLFPAQHRGYKLNHSLIQTLKDHNITNIYLFTDAELTAEVFGELSILIQTITNLDLKVHGVITTLDLVWDKVPDKKLDLDNFAQELEKIQIYNGNEKQKHFIKLNKIYKFVEPSLYRSLSTVQCGSAYADAVEAYKTIVPNNMATRSEIAKALANQMAWNQQYIDTKGLLLKTFVDRKPEWISSVIIFDNQKSVIDSVDQYKSRHPATISKTPVSAAQVKNIYQNEESDLEIKVKNRKEITANLDLDQTFIKQITKEIQTEIKAKNLEQSKEEYSKAISAHLDLDQNFITHPQAEKPSQTIKQYVDRPNVSRFNFFLHSPQSKFAMLKPRKSHYHLLR